MSNCNRAARHGVPTVHTPDHPERAHFGAGRACTSLQHGAGWDLHSRGLQKPNHPSVALQEGKVGLQQRFCKQDGRGHFCKLGCRTGPFQLPVRETFQLNQLFFNRAGWFSKPDSCLPPPPLLPGFDLGTSTPKPITEPWSFLPLGWEAGARQPKQRQEKSPHSGGSSGGEEMASFPSRSLQDYAKPLNVGLHMLSSGARPLTALFWGGWRAQHARLPP